MITWFIRFMNEKKFLYLLVSFVLMLSGAFLPFLPDIKLYLALAGITFLYLFWLRDSIIWACTISRMIIWLLIAPGIISLVIIGYISVFWNEVLYNMPFSIGFILFFIIVWTLAAYNFDKRKIRAAMTFINAVTLTTLGLTFIFYFNVGNSFIPMSQADLTELTAAGLSQASLLEILIKMITLPYFLAGIWGLAVLEIREAKFLS